jgi:hypothetical protein
MRSAASASPIADGNGNGVIDLADYEIWKAHFGDTIGSIMGDFDESGFVDSGDFTVWRDGFGSIYTMEDYDNWKAHFGQSVGGPGAGGGIGQTVPEPAAFVLWSTVLVANLLRAARIRPR